MRRIKRLRLSAATKTALQTEQHRADEKRGAGNLNIAAEWKRARQTQPLLLALGILKTMAGPRERCMYCGDSHGTDIEHYWPKTPYPGRMFRWTNMLLGCTDCGRIKGSRFPLDAAGRPLMVKPTHDDPWEFLDFDPLTGNLVARFHLHLNGTTQKGDKTVDTLKLDQREALAKGYQKSFVRIKEKLAAALVAPAPDPQALILELTAADDHGLLGWCFRGNGVNEQPLSDLRQLHPAVWTACEQAFRHS